jgi:hypothetical protein
MYSNNNNIRFVLCTLLLCILLYAQQSNAQWTKTAFLNTLNFASGQMVTIPGGSPLYALRYLYTTEMWIKPASAALTDSTLVCTKDGVELVKLVNGYIVCRDMYSTSYSVTSTTQLTAGTWAHIACTRATTIMSVYINGGTPQTTTIASNRLDKVGIDVVLGAYTSDGTTYSKQYTGEMDEVRFFTKARTQSELNANKNIQLGSTETGLQCYLKFDESSGQTLSDSQTNTATYNGYLGKTTSVESSDPTRTNQNPVLANAILDYVWSVADDGTATSFSIQVPEQSPNRFTDSDDTTLYYTATLVSGSTIPGFLDYSDGGTTQTLTGVATNLDAGTYNVRITASDRIGSAYDDFLLTVNRVPKLVTPLVDQTATVGTAFTYTFASNTFVDSDSGQTLSYTYSLAQGGTLGSGTWLTFTSGTRTFTGTPRSTDGGKFFISVCASDTFASMCDVFLLTVNCPSTYYTRCAFGNSHLHVATESDVSVIPSGATLLSGVNVWTTEMWIRPNTLAASTLLGTAGGKSIIDMNASGNIIMSTYAGTTLTSTGALTVWGWTHVTVVRNSATCTIYLNGTASGTTASCGASMGTDTTDLIMGGKSSFANFYDGYIDDVRIWSADVNAQISTNRFKELFGNETNLIGYWKINDGSSVQTVTNVGSSGSTYNGYRGQTTASATNDPSSVQWNYVPSISAVTTNQAITVSVSTLSYTCPAFTDLDFDVVSYTSTQSSGAALPTWTSGVTFTAGTRVFSGSPAAAHAAIYTFRVYGNDGIGSGYAEFTVTVNRKPTATAITSQYVNAGSALSYTVPASTFTDPDGNALTYTYSVSPTSAWLTFTAATQTFTGNPATTDYGSKTVTVTAADGFTSSTVSQAFTLLVNRPPVVASAPAAQSCTATISSSFQFASGTFTDADANTLTYTATLSPSGSLPSFITFTSATRTFAWNAIVSDAGTYSILLTASDSYSTVSTTFSLYVNRKPTITNAVPDMYISNGDAFSYTLTSDEFTDPDGQTLTLTVAQSSGSALPAWLTYTGASKLFSGTPATTDYASLTIRVTANDGYTSTTYDDFVLLVNRKPTVANVISAQYVNIGSSLSFQFASNTFNDADANTLTYTATLSPSGSLPGWLTFTSATRTFSGTPAAGNFGSLSILLTASDSYSTVSTTFTLKVNRVPTVANALTDTAANTYYLYSLTVPTNTFNDADGDTITYIATISPASSLPAWLSFDTNTRVLSGTPTNADAGNIRIRITGSDGMSSAYSEFSINVNRSPTVANSIPNQWVIFGNAWTYTVAANTFTDPDGDTLTYSASMQDGTALPSFISFNSGTLTFTAPTPGSNAGDFLLRVIASDSKALGYANFKYTLNRVPTVANTIPNQIVTIARAAMNYQVPANTFNDSDGHGLTLSVTLSPSGSLPTWLSFNTVTNTFTGSPTVSDFGTITIKVTASDGMQTCFTTVQILVNRPPTLVSPLANAIVTVGNLISLSVPESRFTDSDGNTITVTITKQDGTALPSWIVYSDGANTLSGTPTSSDYGNLLVRVIGSDTMSTTNNDFTILVNRRPVVANAISNKRATVAVAYSFQFASNVFTDADGDTMTYSATGLSGASLPAWISFNAATRTFSGTPALADVQTFTVEVTAADTDSTIMNSFTITVNRRPQVDNTISNHFTNIGYSYSFTFNSNTFSDADGDALTYTAALSSSASLPAWLSFNGATRTFSGSPTNSDAATLTIRITTDDGAATQYTDFQLIVNRRPVVSSTISNMFTNTNTAYSYQFASGTFTDPDGNSMTYSATLADDSSLPAWLTFTSVSRTFSANTINAYAGSYNIKVTATDTMANQNTTFTLLVNRIPVLANAVPSQVITVGNALSYTIPSNTFTDADSNTITLSALKSPSAALPSWISFNPATNVFSGSPASTDAGTLTIRITATDTMGTTTHDFDILVNRRPTVSNTIPYQTVTVGNTYNYTVPANIFADADSNTLSLTASKSDGTALPAWLTFDPSIVTFYGAPSDSDAGNLTIKVVATDSYSTISTTYTVYVNRKPIVSNTIASKYVTIGYSYLFVVPSNTFTDPDNNTLTYTSTLNNGNPLPVWMTFTGATRTFSGTPTLADVATLTIRVIADDGLSNYYTPYTLVINRVPVLDNSITNQIVNAGESMYFGVPVNTFSDPDGNTLYLTATTSPTNSLPAWLSFNDTTNLFTGTPASGDAGVVTLRVTASDTMATVFTQFTVLVNRKPTATQTIANQYVTIGYSYSYLVPSGIFSDADGNSVTVSSSLLNGTLPLWLNFNPSAMFYSGTPSSTDYGVLTIRLKGTDGMGSTYIDFGLTVNRQPVVNNPINSQLVTIGNSFTFNVPNNIFYDADGDSLDLSSTLTSGASLPTWLTFNSVAAAYTGTPTSSDYGVLTIRLTASDRKSLIQASFTVTVNRAPTLANQIPDQYANIGSTFTYAVPASTFVDADGTTLSLSALKSDGTALPSWLVFIPTTNSFFGFPSTGDQGTVSVRVTGSDGYASASDVFDLFVNRKPVVSQAIAAQYVNVGSALSFSIPSGTFTDPDNNTLTYSATLSSGSALPAWMTFSVDTFSGTPVSADATTLTIRVTATDTMSSIYTDFTLLVNKRPVAANTIADQAVTIGNTYTYTVPNNTFTDPEVHSMTYSVTLQDGTALPSWLSFTANTRSFSGSPTSSDFGTLHISVTASDSMATELTTFALLVNRAPTVVTQVADQVVTVDSALALAITSGTFDDADNNALTLSASKSDGTALPAWLTFNVGTNAFSGTPSLADAGDLLVKLKANDGYTFVSQTFTIKVNRKPVVVIPVSSKSAITDELLSFQIPVNTFSDPDGNALIYSAGRTDGSVLPAWLAFDSTTRTFTGSPSSSDVGSIVVRLSVTDIYAARGFTDFVINVEPPGSSSGISDKVVTVGNILSFNVLVSAFPTVDNSSITMNATLQDGNVLPAWLVWNTTAYSFYGAPTNANAGTVYCRVRATDGVNTEIADFRILVNRRPVVTNTVANRTVTVGSLLTFTLPTPVFTDPDSNAMAISASLADGSPIPAWLSFTGTGFTGTPAYTDAGLKTINLRATDGYVATDTQFSMLVNRSPVVAHRLSDDKVNAGSVWTKVISNTTFEDADGDTLTYVATKLDGSALPVWITFDTTTLTFNGTPSLANYGSVSLQLRASDGLAYVTNAFVLVVNRPPVLSNNITSQYVTVGSVFSYTIPSGTFSDPDSNILTLTITQLDGSALPAWIAFNPGNNQFFGFPDNTDAGLLNVTATASDGSAQVSTGFSIRVNRKPTVQNSIPQQYITAGIDSYSYTIPSNTFEDADSDTLTWSAAKKTGAALPSWLTFDATNYRLSGTPTTSDFGSITIRITVSDTLTTAYTDFILLVNRAPILLNPLANQLITAGNTFNYLFAVNTFFDADATALTYSATLSDATALPSWIIFNAPTRSFSGAPATSDSGTYYITVTATDTMASVNGTFSMIVNRGPMLINAVGAQTATVGETLTISVANAYQDPDGNPLTFTSVKTDGTALPSWIVFNSTSLEYTIAPISIVTSVTVRLVASDSFTTSPTQFTVTPVCKSGYSGTTCTTFYCYSKLATDSSVCSSKGICVSPNTCNCTTGYTGTECESMGCYGIPSTSVGQVCNNHGTCTAPDTCRCKTGWLGDACPITKCGGIMSNVSSVCSGHGGCIAPNYCDCDAGYAGTVCQDYTCLEIPRTASGVCSAHGTCISPDNCTCNAGYSSTDCSYFECYGYPSSNSSACSGHGTCSAANTCTCQSGWGVLADCSLTTCFGILQNASTVCSSRGVCVGHHQCVCQSGYTGDNCEKYACYNISSTNSSVCGGVNHGQCLKPDNCTCNTGYTGNDCTIYSCFSLDSKHTAVCSSRGICQDIDHCVCPAGYAFDSDCRRTKCNGTFDDDPTVCSSIGICVDLNTCSCPNGYGGPNCEFFACQGIASTNTSFVCSGHGGCIAPDSCSCQSGYSGVDCSTYSCAGIDSKNSTVCSSHGKCDYVDHCSCYTGYTFNSDCSRTKCNGKFDNDPTVCLSRGNCTAFDSCTCNSGYAGNDCELFSCFGIASTDAAVCTGHGVCNGPNTCQCSAQYSGADCSTYSCYGIDSKSSSVCGGHGTCANIDNCTCNAGYDFDVECRRTKCYGLFDDNLAVCTSRGVCVGLDNCTCFAGYGGPSCANTACYGIVESDASVCSGHGDCIAPNDCSCQSGYSGNDCSIYTCYGIDAKNTTVCSTHGSCSAIDNCTCNFGFNVDADCRRTTCNGTYSDSPSVCSTRGSCVSFDNCSCIAGYYGSNCEKFDCYGTENSNSSVCSQHGTCASPDQCNCQSGYTSNNCSIYSCYGIDSMNSSVCGKHGQCIATDSCSCATGYAFDSDCRRTKCSGVFADSPSVCSSRGTCDSFNTCNCTTGYIGSNCENYKCYGIDYSNTSVVCSGHGTCNSPDTCVCTNGYSGSDCSQYQCFGINSTDTDNVCHGHGPCIAYNNCSCNTGWLLSDCSRTTCQGIYDNSSTVCSGRGSCVALNQCVCQSGFGGTNCQSFACFGLLPSDPLVCTRKGRCISPNTCNCTVGYNGVDCGDYACYGISAKNSSVCSSHGTCEALDSCSCATGFNFDPDCRRTKCYGIYSTVSGVCSGQGVCSSLDNCTCDSGFGGATCSSHTCSNIDWRDPSVCSGHGTCSGPNICDCLTGYNGLNCQDYFCNAISYQDTQHVCTGHGDCIAPDICLCNVGYRYSTDCSKTKCFGIFSSDANVCNGKGSCVAPDTCSCSDGYAGVQCQNSVCNNITSDNSGVCSKHGDCIAPETCVCDTAYNGADCNIYSCYSIFATDSAVCSGHGTCTAIDECECKYGWTGSDCSIPTCYGTPANVASVCSKHGNCTFADTCNCNSPYYGSQCDRYKCFGVDFNSTSVCNGRGSCVAPDTCTCKSGYFGTDCQVTTCFGIYSNSSNVCNKRGTCVALDECLCPTGYNGNQCQTFTCYNKTSTALTVCNRQGTCQSPDNCVCKKGYTGPQCQYLVCFNGNTGVLDSVCNSFGNCTAPDVCSCSTGYSGTECEVPSCYGVKATDNTVCNAHGVCMHKDSCLCNSGYDLFSDCRTQCFGYDWSDPHVCSGHGNCIISNNCSCSTGYTSSNCSVPVCYGYAANSKSVCNGHGICPTPDNCQCKPGSYGLKCEVLISNLTFSGDGSIATASFITPYNTSDLYEFNCQFIVPEESWDILGLEQEVMCSLKNNLLTIRFTNDSAVSIGDQLKFRAYPILPANTTIPIKYPVSNLDLYVATLTLLENPTPKYPEASIDIIHTDREEGFDISDYSIFDCDDVLLTASYSSYDARPLEFTWSSTCNNPESEQVLNDYLSQQTQENSTYLFIPSDKFLVTNANRSETFTIHLTVKSYLGYVNTTSVDLMYTRTPLPVLIPKRTFISLRRSDPYALETYLRMGGKCGNVTEFTVTYNWEQVGGKAIENFDLYPDKNNAQFTIKPFLFPKTDETYTLRVSTTLEQYPFVVGRFKLYVRVIAQSLKALIIGADRYQPINQELTLRGVLTDPDLMTNEENRFEWACSTPAGQPNVPMLCPEERTKSTLSIPTYAMLEGQHQFDFNYHRGYFKDSTGYECTDGATCRQTSTSIIVTVVGASLPVIRIEGVPFNNKMNYFEPLSLTAVCDNYEAGQLNFKWEVVSNKLPLNNNTMSTPNVNQAGLTIKRNVMEPYNTYTFRVIATLKLSGSSSVVAGSSEVPISIQPPTPAIKMDSPFSVTPAVGYAMTTEFTLSCLGWSLDKEPLFFSYAFVDEIDGKTNKTGLLTLAGSVQEKLVTTLPQPTTRSDYKLYIRVRASNLAGAYREEYASVIVKPAPAITNSKELNALANNITSLLDSPSTTKDEQVYGQQMAVLTFALNRAITTTNNNVNTACPNNCNSAKSQGTCDTVNNKCTCSTNWNGDDCSLTSAEITQRQEIREKLLQQYTQFSSENTTTEDHLAFRIQTIDAITAKPSEISTESAKLAVSFVQATMAGNTATLSEETIAKTANVLNSLATVVDTTVRNEATKDSYNQISAQIQTAAQTVMSSILENSAPGEQPTVISTDKVKLVAYKDYPTLLDGKSFTVPSASGASDRKITIPPTLSKSLLAGYNSSNSYYKEPTVGVKILSLGINPYQYTAKSSSDPIASEAISVVFEIDGKEVKVNNLQDPIKFIIPGTYSYNIDASNPSKTAPTCKYWDTKTSSWKTDGVWAISFSKTNLECATNHTTDYAAFITAYYPPVVIQPPPPPAAKSSLVADDSETGVSGTKSSWLWILIVALCACLFFVFLLLLIILGMFVYIRRRNKVQDEDTAVTEEESSDTASQSSEMSAAPFAKKDTLQRAASRKVVNNYMTSEEEPEDGDFQIHPMDYEGSNGEAAVGDEGEENIEVPVDEPKFQNFVVRYVDDEELWEEDNDL